MRNLLLIVAVLTLTGCTADQVARAEQAAASAQSALMQAEQIVNVAKAAVAAAQDAASKNLPGAVEALSKANHALDVAQATIPALKATADGAHQAAVAAKEAQAAGGGWFAVLVGVVSTAIPAAGGVIMAVAKSVSAIRALRQTTEGLDAAREALGEDAWKCKVAPALMDAQDEATKVKVRRIQAGV